MDSCSYAVLYWWAAACASSRCSAKAACFCASSAYFSCTFLLWLMMRRVPAAAPTPIRMLRVLAAPSASAIGFGAIASARAPISAAAINLECLIDGLWLPPRLQTQGGAHNVSPLSLYPRLGGTAMRPLTCRHDPCPFFLIGYA